MFDKYLIKKRLGKKILNLHPSSGRIFKDENGLESLVKKLGGRLMNSSQNIDMFKDDKIPPKGDMSAWICNNLELGYNLAMSIGYASLLIPYIALESSARISETGVRIVSKSVKTVAKSVGNHQSKFTFRRKYARASDSIKGISNKIEKVTNKSKFLRRTSDLVTVGFSLWLGFHSYKFTQNPEEYENLIPSFQISKTITEPIPLHDISYFKPGKDILVLVADQKEKNGIKLNFKERDKSLIFSSKNNITTVIKDNYKMQIVRSDQEIPVKVGGYNLINLRGHTEDMLDLYIKAKPHMADYTLLMLGGSGATKFVSEWATENVAVIGRDTTNDTSQNTYLLLRTLSIMPTCTTWTQYANELKSMSKYAKTDFVIPGDSTKYTRNRTQSIFEATAELIGF